MFEEAALDSRLTAIPFGADDYKEYKTYSWLTISAPSGSNAQKDAKQSGVNFIATTEEENSKSDNSFLGKIKAFFAKIRQFFKKIIAKIKAPFEK